MIRPRKIPHGAGPLPRQWKHAIQHIDEALQKNAPQDFSEQIQILGRHMFGDLWQYNPTDPKD